VEKKNKTKKKSNTKKKTSSNKVKKKIDNNMLKAATASFEASPSDLLLIGKSDLFLSNIYSALQACETGVSVLDGFKEFIDGELPSGILSGIHGIILTQQSATIEQDEVKMAETKRLYDISSLILCTLYVTWCRLRVHYPKEKN
jgi:hypothetical protein